LLIHKPCNSPKLYLIFNNFVMPLFAHIDNVPVNFSDPNVSLRQHGFVTDFGLDLSSSATAPILRGAPLGGESGRTLFAFFKSGLPQAHD